MNISIDLNDYNTAKQALQAAVNLDANTSKFISSLGRHAAKLAIEETATDPKIAKLNATERYNVIHALYKEVIDGNKTVDRAFKNSLLLLVKPDFAVSIESKNDKGEKVEVQSTAATIVDTGTKRELEEAAKQLREDLGLGRKRAPKPAGSATAKAPTVTSGDNVKTQPLSMTPEQLHNPILSAIELRLQAEDEQFIEKMKQLLNAHGLTISKKRPTRQAKAKKAA